MDYSPAVGIACQGLKATAERDPASVQVVAVKLLPSGLALQPYATGTAAISADLGSIFYLDEGNTTDGGLGQVLRLACLVSAWRDGGILLHAAGLASRGPDKRAVIAVAPSGGGKSTLTDLADSFDSLSDELLVLDEHQGRARVRATRFRSSSTKVPIFAECPIAGFALLEKARSCRLARLQPSAAAPSVLVQAYLPAFIRGARAELLRRIGRLLELAPAFRFAFDRSPQANLLLEQLLDETA